MRVKVKSDSGEVRDLKDVVLNNDAPVPESDNDSVAPAQVVSVVSNAGDLLSSFATGTLVFPVEIEYFVSGETDSEVAAVMRKEQYFIKKLSPAEFFEVDGKSIKRKANGQPDFDPVYQQTHGFKHQIAACVVINQGSEQEPDWKPLFAVDDLYKEWHEKGVKRTSGLISNARAENLIYNLLGQIWRVNPGLDPFAKQKIALKMQQEAA